MKARPILFSGPMVRALLEGRKSQTRRVVNPQPYDKYSGPPGADHWHKESEYHYRCAHGLPGDLLWCRETCRAEELGSGLDGVRYLADSTFRKIDDSTEAAERWSKLRHYRGGRGEAVRSIHMPRWASRLTLRLTDVRVERLQDISEDDARAEGMETDDFLDHDDWQRSVAPAGIPCTFRTLRSDFCALWDTLNEKRGFGWDVNPWVWALSFEVIQSNVDNVLEQQS